MRLRNIPRADDTLQAHFTVIKNPKEFRGNWTSVFGNDRPIRIEIGMGKGRFLLNLSLIHIYIYMERAEEDFEKVGS